MSENKTKPTNASVKAFIDSVEDENKRRDCRTLLALMKEITGKRPTMWGTSIVGFGSYHYKYATGREGDWFITGFSPRKQDLTIYLMPEIASDDPLLSKLGKHKLGKCCLYVKRLDDVDLAALRQLVSNSIARMRKHYACK